MKKDLSDDIREWCHQLIDDKKDNKQEEFKPLVIFEDYKKTISRGEKAETEDYEESDEDEDYFLKLKDLPSIYNSPIGPVSIPELTDASKYFKLWTMYTNIPLTSRLISKIENINGVESIEYLTKYRARIGIAPLFKDGKVMDKVEIAIKSSIRPEIKTIFNSGE